MSHYFGVAILPGMPQINVAEWPEVSEIMAPYQERYDESTQDSTGFWDYWVIGGRWDGVWGDTNAAYVRDIIGHEYLPYTIFTPDRAICHLDLNPYPEGDYTKEKWDAWAKRDRKVTEVEWPSLCRQTLSQLANLDAVAVIVDYHC